jgi:hypothetical protein
MDTKHSCSAFTKCLNCRQMSNQCPVNMWQGSFQVTIQLHIRSAKSKFLDFILTSFYCYIPTSYLFACNSVSNSVHYTCCHTHHCCGAALVFVFLALVVMKSPPFWDIIWCSFLKVEQHFRWTMWASAWYVAHSGFLQSKQQTPRPKSASELCQSSNHRSMTKLVPRG